MTNSRVLIPNMPSPDELMPYLRRMHGARVYVNNGPLVVELEERIQHEIGLPCRMVSNGTVAIQLALQALHLRQRSRVLVPAVTFAGTGLAIRNAGHLPADIDAVVPVAAFGMPLDIGPWVAWAEAMNKPVVVDAAGCLLDQPTCESARVLFAYSLHATKFIGAGEGGCVAAASVTMLDRVTDLARFGHGGTNAKMSEYHAAVAHASLDTADDRSERARVIRQRYIARLLRAMPQLRFQRPPMPLEARGIECRQWYRAFLNERTDMLQHRLPDLPVTRELIERQIGLPFHQLMTIDDVDTVCAHLEAVCES